MHNWGRLEDHRRQKTNSFEFVYKPCVIIQNIRDPTWWDIFEPIAFGMCLDFSFVCQQGSECLCRLLRRCAVLDHACSPHIIDIHIRVFFASLSKLSFPPNIVNFVIFLVGEWSELTMLCMRLRTLLKGNCNHGSETLSGIRSHLVPTLGGESS